ncbi:MAG: hypothetical protein G01um101466_67 [Parcubacteria group bacterium Gr01-1014_66]|nr:MAG: hypothetical protein G01um101466_67 [Parcubacteria group bacterium Gr01-1014_66]
MLDANLPNPFTDLPTLRAIRITEKTTISKLEQKDQITFQREYAEFQKQLGKQTAGTGPGSRLASPDLFRQTPATLADLKKGQSVGVTGDGDISAKESFDAVSIQVIVTSVNQPSVPVQ